MSNTNPEVDELLRQGIQAARSEDKAAARTLLERVVELDEQNEKGWFWLASVVDTVEEKRVCLGNVVVINPNNERAQHLLDQLETKASIAAQSRKKTGGINSKTVYAAIGLGVVTVILLVIVLVVMLTQDDSETPSTPANVAVTRTSPTPVDASSAGVGGTPEIADSSPTPDEGSLPPTWTPAPSETPPEVEQATPLPSPPPDIGGKIIMQSGLVIGDDNNNPIALLPLDGSSVSLIAGSSARGHAPILSPNGASFAYIRFSTGTREELLEINRLDGSTPQWVNALWGNDPILVEYDTPAWSPNGEWIVFCARELNAQAPDLFFVPLTGTSPEDLQPLTRDAAAESWPAFSPDNLEIVYAADLALTGQNTTDLRVYGLEDNSIWDLTSNGAALIEAAPDWSPDGQTIIFHASEGEGKPADIYFIPADTSAPEQKLIKSPGDDIRPRYSPDGQYIVFSSNRTGNWDVFVYEIATEMIYQVTSDPGPDIANDWGR